jgi:hypothetical protein
VTETYPYAGPVTHTYDDGTVERTITIDLVDEDGTFADADANGQGGAVVIRPQGGRLEISWTGWGTLQSAASVNGPYEDVITGGAPYLADPSGPQRFYRVLRSFAVRVNDVAPCIELSGAHTVDAGALYTLTLGRVIDPGKDTVSQYVVHWGDGKMDRYTSAGQVTHVYDSGPADRTIQIDLVDEDGAHPDVNGRKDAGPLAIHRAGAQLQLAWTGWGVLQAADSLDGQYQDLVAGIGPYLVSPSASRQFYRLLPSFDVHVNAAAAPQLDTSLFLARPGNTWQLEWTGSAILQVANSVTGPYADLFTGAGPYAIDLSGPQRFYRLLRSIG